MEFLHEMVVKGYTSLDQIADKYEQMNPKFNDGKYGSLFMWGLGTDYDKAGMLGEDKIHMAMVPQFSEQKYIFTDSWSYVLNTASQNKDAAIKFLQYMTSEEGMIGFHILLCFGAEIINCYLILYIRLEYCSHSRNKFHCLWQHRANYIEIYCNIRSSIHAFSYSVWNRAGFNFEYEI